MSRLFFVHPIKTLKPPWMLNPHPQIQGWFSTRLVENSGRRSLSIFDKNSESAGLGG